MLAASGYCGFSMVVSHKREERILRQILSSIHYMGCELQFRLTPLPQLLRQAAAENNGTTNIVLDVLARELESQISPNVSCCMDAVLGMQRNVPRRAGEVFRSLGRGLGRFELQGQLRELECVRAECERYLAELESNRDVRFRSYQTLGLCAGAALAILLL